MTSNPDSRMTQTQDQARAVEADIKTAIAWTTDELERRERASTRATTLQAVVNHLAAANNFRTLLASHAAQAEEIERLNERLENNHMFDAQGGRVDVEPGSIPDGIECRDETIKFQDERITAQAETIKSLSEALKRLSSAECMDVNARAADLSLSRELSDRRIFAANALSKALPSTPNTGEQSQ